jgi:hypothetical protein
VSKNFHIELTNVIQAMAYRCSRRMMGHTMVFVLPVALMFLILTTINQQAIDQYSK